MRLKPERPSRCSTIMSTQQDAERFYLLAKGRMKLTRQNLTTAPEPTVFLSGSGAAVGFIGVVSGLFGSICAETLGHVLALSVRTRSVGGGVERLIGSPRIHECLRGPAFGQARRTRQWTFVLHDAETLLARLILRHFDTTSGFLKLEEVLRRDFPHKELRLHDRFRPDGG